MCLSPGYIGFFIAQKAHCVLLDAPFWRKGSQLNNDIALQVCTDNATIEELEEMSAAIHMAKMKKEKERTVIERFGKPYITTRKKNGKVYEYYRVDYRDETGARQQASARELDDLIDKLWLIIREENPYALHSYSTVKDTFDRYMQRRNELVEAGAISSQTAAYDVSNWNRFFANRDFVNLPICKTSTYLLEQEFRMICGDGTKYTRKTFNKAKSLMNGIYKEAVSDGIIPMNYAANASLDLCKFIVEYVSEEEDLENYYSQEDVQKLRAYLRTLPKTTYSLGVLLHTYLICRVGETRALTWDDYNPETGEMEIWHEITKKKIGNVNRSDFDKHCTKSGKSQGRRTIALPEEAMEVVEELRKINGSKKYILNGKGDAKFSVPTNRFNAHIKQYCEACGIKYHSSHKFRFYGITRLYENNVDEESIRYTAGHTTLEMTRHYDKSHSKRKMVSREIMASL